MEVVPDIDADEVFKTGSGSADISISVVGPAVVTLSGIAWAYDNAAGAGASKTMIISSPGGFRFWMPVLTAGMHVVYFNPPRQFTLGENEDLVFQLSGPDIGSGFVNLLGYNKRSL